MALPAPASPASLDFPPDTTVIVYMRKQNLTWLIVLKELLDNAIDAGATQIRLTISRTQVLIEDNGRGCGDLMRMITLGRHVAHDETQIGQYGVGGKDAFIWLADRLAIVSVAQGIRHEVAINWEMILQRHAWRLEQPIAQTQTQEPSGTRITLTALRHRRPEKDRLLDELSRTYMPALRDGCQILLKYYTDADFIPIKPFSFPPLYPQQHETIVVEGKTAHVTLGIVPLDVTLPSRGLMCLYGPRVIVHQKRLGIPPESLAEIFGWVVFEPGDWTLEKNKTDFLDDLDPLAEEIERRFAPLFAEAAQRHKARPMENVLARINEYLKQFQHAGQSRKALRPGLPMKTGAVKATGTGGKHTQAAQTQPGSTFTQRKYLSVDLAALSPEGPLCNVIGDVIVINQEDPYIQQSLNNELLLEINIRWIAAILLGTEEEGPQIRLPWAGAVFDTKERIYTMGKALAGLSLRTAIRREEPTP